MTQIQIPPLADGETYLIGLVDANGDVEHTVLLPGDKDDASQAEQFAWAKSLGGDLPNRIEQAVMFAKFRDRFQKDAYWSNETCDWGSSFAWCQNFNDGLQYSYRKSAALRAVAVRRFKN
jgi:hypothetical protein